MKLRSNLIVGISLLSTLMGMSALPALAHDDWEIDITIRAIRRDIVRDEIRIRELECRKHEADRYHDRDESWRLRRELDCAKDDLRNDHRALDRAIDAARRYSHREHDRDGWRWEHSRRDWR